MTYRLVVIMSDGLVLRDRWGSLASLQSLIELQQCYEYEQGLQAFIEYRPS